MSGTIMLPSGLPRMHFSCGRTVGMFAMSPSFHAIAPYTVHSSTVQETATIYVSLS